MLRLPFTLRFCCGTGVPTPTFTAGLKKEPVIADSGLTEVEAAADFCAGRECAGGVVIDVPLCVAGGILESENFLPCTLAANAERTARSEGADADVAPGWARRLRRRWAE